MGSLGSYLRELREAKGASLQEMSRATRISKRYFEALEVEALGDLPAPVFVRGFLKAYCDFLQVPPDEALARYRALQGDLAPPAHALPPRQVGQAWTRNPLVLAVALLLLLGLALIGFRLLLMSGSQSRSVQSAAPPTTASPVPASSATAPEPASRAAGRDGAPPRPGSDVSSQPTPRAQASPADTFGPAPAAARAGSPAAPATPQRLLIRAVEESWVLVKLDNGTIVQELLPIGAVREWTSERRFLLTLGNAGGVEIELNGQRLPPLGRQGEVVRDIGLPRTPATSGS